MQTVTRQWPLRAELEQPRTATATLRSMQVGQHVIAVALAIIGVARATSEGTPVLVAIGAATVLLLWYGTGILLSSRPSTGTSARWWLVGLTLIWAGSVIISAEFVWFAFVLWLLAGQLLTRWVSIAYSVLVFAAVAFAPVAHIGSTNYASVFGPLIGGIFALGVSRGYLELRRDARERELLVESLQLAHQDMAGLQEELALTQRHSGAIEERTRLSRDIHDTIAQGLSSIALLVRAELQQDPGVDTTRTLQQVETLAADSLTDVRRIVAELTPSELEDNGACQVDCVSGGESVG
ncbi:MAG: histidine kinase [Arachnia sp.]